MKILLPEYNPLPVTVYPTTLLLVDQFQVQRSIKFRYSAAFGIRQSSPHCFAAPSNAGSRMPSAPTAPMACNWSSVLPYVDALKLYPVFEPSLATHWLFCHL